MSPKLPVISGYQAVKALSKFGFTPVRQHGDHLVMQKGIIVFSVPLHRTLKKGTLLAILKQANISKEEFVGKL